MAANKKTKSKKSKSKKKTKSKSKTTSVKSKQKRSDENKTSREKTEMIKTKKFWVLVAVLVIAGLAYLFRGVFLAAMVNGKPISRLEVIRELEKQGGSQTLDQLVTQALIEQEAREQGVSISEQEVEDQIGQIRSGLEGQGQNFEELLSLQGMSMQDLRTNIRTQLTLEKLVEGKVEVGDEEIQEFLEQNEDQLSEDLSPEELQELARDQLTQQKMQQVTQSFLEELKQNANIRYFTNY